MAKAYANQLGQALQANPNIILLWGDDAGALKQAQAQVVAHTKIDPADPFAADRLGATEVAQTPALLTDAATTMPFGGGRKLITLGGVSGTESAEVIKNLTEAVQATLQFNLSGCTVVLAIPQVLTSTSPLVKLIEGASNGLSVRFYADTARDLTTYIQTNLNAAGVRAEQPAMRLLAAGLGADREIAARELEKLLLYITPAQTLTVADVQASLSGAPKVDNFVLADAVANRDLQHTDTLLQLLLAEGDTLESSFHAVSRHLNQLAQGQALLNAGEEAFTVLAKLGKAKAPKEAQEAITRQMRSYPPARLKTLPAYTYKTLADARRHGATAPLTLARAILALSA